MKTITRAIFAIVTIFTLTAPMAFAGWPIPHSGQTKCYDDKNEIACPEPGKDYYGQDGNYTELNPRSYTKLGNNGEELPDSATSWIMVRDNVTGLIWEVKQAKDGTKDYENPNDADNKYTWYDSNPATNGGSAGTSGNGTDTEDFINALNLNTENFGGHSDWRLPTIKELASITNLGKSNPAIDAEYFHSTKMSDYWSATANASHTSSAWCVLFSYGSDASYDKSGSRYVRGVRSGQ